MDVSLAQKSVSKSEGFRFRETGNHVELCNEARITVKSSCMVNVKILWHAGLC